MLIGRILEVGAKRWRVDVRSRLDGVLLLSSVNLPGGVQVTSAAADLTADCSPDPTATPLTADCSPDLTATPLTATPMTPTTDNSAASRSRTPFRCEPFSRRETCSWYVPGGCAVVVVAERAERERSVADDHCLPTTFHLRDPPCSPSLHVT